MLANPAQSVTEIGLALGFSETSAFSSAFRHTTGMTPTEYRRTWDKPRAWRTCCQSRT
ncbi:helix-turn-helix domain-containing protein [Bradyrhizobium sp. LB13.1]